MTNLNNDKLDLSQRGGIIRSTIFASTSLGLVVIRKGPEILCLLKNGDRKVVTSTRHGSFTTKFHWTKLNCYMFLFLFPFPSPFRITFPILLPGILVFGIFMSAYYLAQYKMLNQI